MSKDHDGIDDPGTRENVDPAADAAHGADEQNLPDFGATASHSPADDDPLADGDDQDGAEVRLSKADPAGGSHPVGDGTDFDMNADMSADSDINSDSDSDFDSESDTDSDSDIDPDMHSDEDADVAVPVGAGVAAGSARAAARRSAVRSGVTETKGRPTASREDSEPRRPNVFARVAKFLREVIGELRKVIWPTRNQMVTYTSVVLVFVIFMTALVFGLDWVFARGVLAVFG